MFDDVDKQNLIKHYAQVTTFTPMNVLDILSTVGGMLGLFLGGSLFSLIELIYDSTLVFNSISKALFILCNTFQ